MTRQKSWTTRGIFNTLQDSNKPREEEEQVPRRRINEGGSKEGNVAGTQREKDRTWRC